MSIINLLIFVLCFYKTTSQECAVAISAPGSGELIIPEFQSGSVILTAPGKPVRQTYYNVTLKNTTVPKPAADGTTKSLQIIVGISYIESFMASDSLDFSVRAAPFGSYITISFVMDVNASWTFAYVNYVATTRYDFRVGTIVANNPELVIPDTSGTTKVVKINYFFGTERKLAENLTSLRVQAHLTGIKCNQRFVEAIVSDAVLNAKQNTFSLEVSLNFQRQPIELLYITYIIYPQISIDWKAGPVTDFVNVFKNKIENSDNKSYFGISKINAKSVGVNGQAPAPPARRMLATIDLQLVRNFWTNYEVRALSFEYNPPGLRAVPRIGDGTQGVPANSTPANDSTCYTLQACMSNGGEFVQTRSGLRCAICRQYSRFSYDADRCVCLADFYDDNGTCRNLSSLCQLNQLYFNGVCYKESQKIIGGGCRVSEFNNTISGKCQCRPEFTTYYTSKGERKCGEACKFGLEFQVSMQRCICRSNQYDNSGMCTKCQANSQWIYALKRCECLPGYSKVGDNCFKCATNAKYDSGTRSCKCNPGYIGLGTICRVIEPRLTDNFTILFSDSKPPGQ